MRKPKAKTKPQRKRASPMPVPRPWMRVSEMAVAASRRRPRKADIPLAFTLPTFPPGVVPKGTPTMAQDGDISAANAWAAQAVYNGAFIEGTTFLGYTYLSELAQRPEYRRISEVLATEATRKWIKLASKGDDDKADKIKELSAEMERLDVRGAFREMVELDGFFGRAHLYLDMGTTEDREEIQTPIGDGRDAFTKAKVSKGSLKRLQPVEPVWCYPADYNSNDPLRPDWYKPQMWFCQGKRIHASRLLTFVGREVPDLLKPAYAFGGLSLSQMAKPYVDNWLRTRQAVADLVWSFSVSGIHTDLSTALQGDGDELFRRLEVFNNLRNNRGVMALQNGGDDVKEEFFNVSTPLSSLDSLQAQAQEHMCVSANTLVETERGQIPIQDVTLRDRVMTRAGLAPLAWVGQTGRARTLIEIRTENSTIRVTECHPVYLPETNEFVSARSVRPTDRLAEAPMWPTSTASRSHGAATGGERLRQAITATSKLVVCYIDRFGTLIAGLSRKALTFTTSMRTSSIISFGILNSFSAARTVPNISMMADSGSIDLQPLIPKNASSVALCSSPSSRSGHFTAGAPAKPKLGEVAIRSILRIETDEPVYNLTVAEGYLPEFYANGVLTHNCSVTGTPVVKLLGIQPAGLNASSQGELESWYDWVEAFQEKFISEKLTRVLDFVMISLWGERDPDITYTYESLRSDDPVASATERKILAETDATLIDAGVILGEESRQRIANDPESGYSGINVDEVPVPASEEADPDALRGEGTLDGPRDETAEPGEQAAA